MNQINWLEQIKVHIADDHHLLREGVMALLNTVNHIEAIGESSNGLELLEWLKENKVDIVILDIQMPELNGIEFLNYLNSNSIDQDIIVLSSYDNLSIIQHFIMNGAKGYLNKSEAAELIIPAIESVHNGFVFVSQETKEAIIDKYLDEELAIKDSDSFLNKILSPRETEVLGLIDDDYNNKEISETLDIGSSTLKTHLRRIKEKFGFKNRVGNDNLAFVFKLFNKI